MTQATRDPRFQVTVYEGNEWAEVTRVPGVYAMGFRAYVWVEAVRPGDTLPR